MGKVVLERETRGGKERKRKRKVRAGRTTIGMCRSSLFVSQRYDMVVLASLSVESLTFTTLLSRSLVVERRFSVELLRESAVGEGMPRRWWLLEKEFDDDVSCHLHPRPKALWFISPRWHQPPQSTYRKRFPPVCKDTHPHQLSRAFVKKLKSKRVTS